MNATVKKIYRACACAAHACLKRYRTRKEGGGGDDVQQHDVRQYKLQY